MQRQLVASVVAGVAGSAAPGTADVAAVWGNVVEAHAVVVARPGATHCDPTADGARPGWACSDRRVFVRALSERLGVLSEAASMAATVRDRVVVGVGCGV